MVWEVLAIWAIVGAVVVWFMRDEKRRRDQVLSARAQRFAETPYRRASSRPSQEDETLAGTYAAKVTTVVAPVTAALDQHDLDFIAQLRQEALETA